MAYVPPKRKARTRPQTRRPPPLTSRAERARTPSDSTEHARSEPCMCRWELRTMGDNYLLLHLKHPDGHWCDSQCSRRDHIVARVYASEHQVVAIATARVASDPSSGHPPRVVSSHPDAARHADADSDGIAGRLAPLTFADNLGASQLRTGESAPRRLARQGRKRARRKARL